MSWSEKTSGASATLENPKNSPVLYPPDRRFRFWVRPSIVAILLSVALIPIVLAWLQYVIRRLPDVPVSPRMMPDVASTPHGFPAWLRITHYINFFFIGLLARSGLSILFDHPRLYWNVHSQPGSDWARFTSKKIDAATACTVDGYWSARDDSR